MASKQELKARLKSIKTIKKITNAMQMIANAKLFKTKKEMLKNKEYANELYDVVCEIVQSYPNLESQYLALNQNSVTLYIVYSSDLGMCGGYNSKIQSYLKQHIKEQDQIILIGKKAKKEFRQHKILNSYSSDNFDFNCAKEIGELAIKLFLDQVIGQVIVVYTEFVNNMTFEPTSVILLPFKAQKTKFNSELLFEPDPLSIIEELIPLMVNNMIYTTYLRSKSSEHGARRFAMEKASDNALELEEKITLKYNQTRQQAITQEITEIVAGSNN